MQPEGTAGLRCDEFAGGGLVGFGAAFRRNGIHIEIGTPVGVLTTEPGTGVHLLVGPFMGDRRLHE